MRPAPPTYIDNFYLFFCEGLSTVASWKVECLVVLVLQRVLHCLCGRLCTQVVKTENHQCWKCVCVLCVGRRRKRTLYTSQDMHMAVLLQVCKGS